MLKIIVVSLIIFILFCLLSIGIIIIVSKKKNSEDKPEVKEKQKDDSGKRWLEKTKSKLSFLWNGDWFKYVLAIIFFGLIFERFGGIYFWNSLTGWAGLLLFMIGVALYINRDPKKPPLYKKLFRWVLAFATIYLAGHTAYNFHETYYSKDGKVEANTVKETAFNLWAYINPSDIGVIKTKQVNITSKYRFLNISINHLNQDMDCYEVMDYSFSRSVILKATVYNDLNDHVKSEEIIERFKDGFREKFGILNRTKIEVKKLPDDPDDYTKVVITYKKIECKAPKK